MTSRRLFLAKLAGLAGFTLLSKAKGDYTKPLSLPVVVQVNRIPKEDRQKIKDALTGSIDYDRLLYCISAVETGHDDTAVGPCGARSRYQISEAVWLQHMDLLGADLTKYPHAKCSDWRARYVAEHHLKWLEMMLTAPTSAYSLAWCWKEGLEAYRQAHSNRSGMSTSVKVALRGHSYGRRVMALYNDPTYQHT